MDEDKLKEIGGVFAEIIRQREKQEQVLIADPSKINYRLKLIHELSIIESANDGFKDELRLFSKFIRVKLWNENNTRDLYTVIHYINASFHIIAEIIGRSMILDIGDIVEYISIMARYKQFYEPNIPNASFEEITDDILKSYYSKVIRSQWDVVLADSDGMKTFMRVFDDVFTNAIEIYEDRFIHQFSEDELLSRCVKQESCNEDRFIPWPNKVQNRWNPPGKTYLYTSLKEQIVQGSPEGITGGQYICLMECRTHHNTDVCFCDFKPVVPGRILDLSYNETPLYSYREMISVESDRVANSSIRRLLNDVDLMRHIDDKQYVMDRIKEDIKKDPLSVDVVTESIAK